MKFGIVGTNWITDRMIMAGNTVEGFEVSAVYSRTAAKAVEFAERHQIAERFTDWENFLSSDSYDALYIATPNMLHYQQTIDALNNGKHVLCEKPMTLSAADGEAMFTAARSNEVVLMEGMKSTESRAFEQLESWVKEIGTVRRVNFHYNQYSSRYDKLKSGIVENAFKPELGNGALTDIGVYTIAPLVRLFGMPGNVMAAVEKLSTGADGQGTVMCQYDEMTAVLSFSKIIDSYLPSEVIGEEGILLIDKISAPAHIVKKSRQGDTIDEYKHTDPPMSYEIRHFMTAVNEKQINQLSEQTTMDTLRLMEIIKAQLDLSWGLTIGK